jgi:hypothetical protein
MDPKPTSTADTTAELIDASMKTEAGLLACAGQARMAIQGFANVLAMTNPPAPELVIRGAMDHIMKSIVRFISFIP